MAHLKTPQSHVFFVDKGDIHFEPKRKESNAKGIKTGEAFCRTCKNGQFSLELTFLYTNTAVNYFFHCGESKTIVR